MHDGRVGFSRWEHLENVNDVKLFAMNPDCTQIVALSGQHGKPGNSLVQVTESQHAQRVLRHRHQPRKHHPSRRAGQARRALADPLAEDQFDEEKSLGRGLHDAHARACRAATSLRRSVATARRRACRTAACWCPGPTAP